MKQASPHRITVIDTHTGGEPTRVVIAGGPDLGCGPLTERRDVFQRDFDRFRSAIANEPRGSDVMVGALLCEPVDASCAAGVIFFNNVGCLGMCGHGTIGVVVALAHLGRIQPGEHRLETPVGVVTATLHPSGEVSVANVPSYRARKAVTVQVPGVGPVTGDVAWGGNWFFLVQKSNPTSDGAPASGPASSDGEQPDRAGLESGAPLSQNYEVRGARPPRAWLDAPSRPASSVCAGFQADAQLHVAGVFREGAENSARGGRAPLFVSGLALSLANVDALTDFCWRVRQAVNSQGFPEVDHVELFGPPTVSGAHSRNFVLCPGKAYDRSPCGTGTSAKLACLAADGKLAEGAAWVQESIIGSTFGGTYRRDGDKILPTITGRAWVNAEATLLLDETDPFCWGIGH